MSSQYNSHRDNKGYEGRRQSDNMYKSGGGFHGERRENNNFHGKDFTCFFCKQVGHRKNECPKLNGQNNRRNNNNNHHNNNHNKNNHSNFVYEENCAPPADEDWGGGEDSEEEKRKKKKESKKAKKQQQLSEIVQEGDENAHDLNAQELQGHEEISRKNSRFNEKMIDESHERQSRQQKSPKKSVNNMPDDEDWGGSDKYENNQRDNDKNSKNQNQYEYSGQSQLQLDIQQSIENAFKTSASIGGSSNPTKFQTAVHPSRNIEYGDKKDNRSSSPQGRDRRGERENGYERKNSRERSREYNNTSSRNKFSDGDNTFRERENNRGDNQRKNKFSDYSTENKFTSSFNNDNKRDNPDYKQPIKTDDSYSRKGDQNKKDDYFSSKRDEFSYINKREDYNSSKREDYNRREDKTKRDDPYEKRGSEISSYKRDDKESGRNGDFNNERKRRSNEDIDNNNSYTRNGDNTESGMRKKYDHSSSSLREKSQFDSSFQRKESKYDDKDRYQNREKKNSSSSYQNKSLRDDQWKRQQRDEISHKYNHLKDEITDKIHEALLSKAFSKPSHNDSDEERDQKPTFKVKQEYGTGNDRDNNERDEWALDDSPTESADNYSKENNTYKSSAANSSSNNYNNSNSNNNNNNSFKFAEFNSQNNRKQDDRHTNKQNNNSSFQEKTTTYSSSGGKTASSQQANNYSSSFMNDHFAKQNKTSPVADPILVISDDEDDPWKSPKNKNTHNNNNNNNNGNNSNKAASISKTNQSSKYNLSDLLNNQEFPPSPVYEPNCDKEPYSKQKLTAILFNPDENKNNDVDYDLPYNIKSESTTATNNNNNYDKMAIENLIYDFDEEDNANDYHKQIKYSENVILYKEIPSQSISLGYDTYSEYFKNKLMNYLYPHKSNQDNCFQVFDGDLRFKKFSESGPTTIKIRCQVFTNHLWDQIKWIPSLKILNQKDKIKEFRPAEYNPIAKQLSQLVPKEKYDRSYYLYWIEGCTQEDQEKIDEYSQYLYSKKLLAGINLETCCLTLGTVNQIFPQVQTFKRNFKDEKSAKIKLVLIYNAEMSFQVSHKTVLF